MVFDVGACYGKKLVSLLNLNSRVVAIEPQERCMKYLKNNFNSNSVYFIQKALGETESIEKLYEGVDHSLSTMSNEWKKKIIENNDDLKHNWKTPYYVSVTTLDSLIKQFGAPSFIKIDVEGYELSVLKGLTRPIKMISIEFIKNNIHNSIDCLKYLNNMGDYRYNYSIGEEHRFFFKTWKNYSEIVNYLVSPSISKWGDIYIKLKE